MYRALPCSDYYGSSVAMPDIHRSTPNSLAAFRFRQSPFRNLTTVWRDRLSDTTFVLYCLWQLPCGQFMLRLLSLISVVPQHDGIIPKNYSTVFRHCPRIRLLRLSFNQYRLYPHIYHFNLPFGRSLTVG